MASGFKGHVYYQHPMDERPRDTRRVNQREAAGSPNATNSVPYDPAISLQQNQQQQSPPPRYNYTQQPTYAEKLNYSQQSLRGKSPPPELNYDVTKYEYSPEDIVLCVDVDCEIETEMRPSVGGAPPGITRLDAIRQALLLFIHAKLRMDTRHHFSVMTISDKPEWLLPRFTSDVNSLHTAVGNIASKGTFGSVDLYPLYHMLTAESAASKARGRTLRLIMLYCRSSVVPHLSLPLPPTTRTVGPTFTADLVYLHSRPSDGLNCPQAAYDALVNALELMSQSESYVFESCSGLARVLFRSMCILLTNPLQRCSQEEFNVPKDISPPQTAQGTTSAQVLAPAPPPPAKPASPLHKFGRKSQSSSTGNKQQAALFNDPNNPYSLHSK